MFKYQLIVLIEILYLVMSYNGARPKVKSSSSVKRCSNFESKSDESTRSPEDGKYAYN